MSDADVNTYEVEEQNPRVIEREEVVVVERRPGTRGELVKFGLLVLVLLATVVIVALLRPYIFNTIIPAVLGEGQPAAPLVSSEAETIKPEVEEEETAVPIDSDTVVEEDTEETPVGNEDAGAEPENPEDFPTAVPSRTHTVQAGENLTTIAQRYGVTVQAIVAANDITNPDRVTIGTTLVIPESQ